VRGDLTRLTVRVLVISNDDANGVEELAVWALTVLRDVPHPDHLAVRLDGDDPLGRR
jgi:hypothetical protein